MAFCVHRWAVIKRWTDKDGFHAIQKCRRCSIWKRSDMKMNTDTGKLEVYDAMQTHAGLENESRKPDNPNPGNLSDKH